ncbi:hypothetical protein N7E81_02445 [Reichenbachiella carrageenanivorans]|uniref:Uncharacterized protein n=1 Tax=Reichenbachiella carrageenanivorans TaxID=2979869 RepID=A0ABY6D1B5_9BACT|nr:hypothetical protein [Reichenbachiella carrageenanivorans]UXX79964.1 hypothetical protein N7E81_02445 [Reichenbachiella carrageenanivorans]
MKNKILVTLVLVTSALVWSCEDTALTSDLDKLAQRLDSLELSSTEALDSLSNVNGKLLDSLAGIAHGVDSLGEVSQHILDSIKALDGYAGPLFLTLSGSENIDEDEDVTYDVSRAFSLQTDAGALSTSIIRYEDSESPESPIETFYEVNVYLKRGSANNYFESGGFFLYLDEDGNILELDAGGEIQVSSETLGSSFYVRFEADTYLDETTGELDGNITINTFSIDLETLELNIDFSFASNSDSESLDTFAGRYSFHDTLVWGTSGER